MFQFGQILVFFQKVQEEGSAVVVAFGGSGTEPSKVAFHLKFFQTIACKHKKSPFHGCPQKGDW